MGTTRTFRNGRRQGLTQDIGSTGLNEQGGRINDDFLRDWNGPRKVKHIDEMLNNSAAVGALRMAIEMPARDVDWYFTGPSGEDDPVLELLQESFDNLTHSWNDHIIDALEMGFYGWSMFTIKYEQKNGRWLWRKFKALGHDTVDHWIFDDKDGGLIGLQQPAYMWPDPIPIERMVLYRFRKSRGSPEGRSILRPAWPSWYYVKNLMKIEAVGIERNLNGLPMIEPPMGADMSDGSPDRQQAEKVLRNVRNDEQGGILLPPPTGEGDQYRWRFSLLSGGGEGKATDTNMVISRYEKRILMTSLAQFLMLGMDSVGAMSTFDGASDFFTMLVNSLLDVIAETFTKYSVERLLTLNGIDPDGYALEHSPAGDIGLAVMADFLSKMSPLLSWTAEDERQLRSLARLPEKTLEQLEEMHEEKKAQTAAMRQAIQQSQQGQQDGRNEPPGNNDNGVDENASIWFGADFPDDHKERLRQEKRMNDKMVEFLNGQQKRVTRGAAELRRLRP